VETVLHPSDNSINDRNCVTLTVGVSQPLDGKPPEAHRSGLAAPFLAAPVLMHRFKVTVME